MEFNIKLKDKYISHQRKSSQIFLKRVNGRLRIYNRHKMISYTNINTHTYIVVCVCIYTHI